MGCWSSRSLGNTDIGKPQLENHGRNICAAISSDGHYLAIRSSGTGIGTGVSIWDAVDGKFLHKLGLRDQDIDIYCLEFFSDGLHLAAVCVEEDHSEIQL